MIFWLWCTTRKQEELAEASKKPKKRMFAGLAKRWQAVKNAVALPEYVEWPERALLQTTNALVLIIGGARVVCAQVCTAL